MSKPLALTQGCSARAWAKKGIKPFIDILEHGDIPSWEELSLKFNLPSSQKRTYHLIKQACVDLGLLKHCYVDLHSFLSFKWADGILLSKIKAQNIYAILNSDSSIINHANMLWYSNLSVLQW